MASPPPGRDALTKNPVDTFVSCSSLPVSGADTSKAKWQICLFVLSPPLYAAAWLFAHSSTRMHCQATHMSSKLGCVCRRTGLSVLNEAQRLALGPVIPG